VRGWPGSPGCGTILNCLPRGNWTETIIYEFTNANGDGSYPEAGLVETPWGIFTAPPCTEDFQRRLRHSVQAGSRHGGGWTESVLYSFTGTGGDGGWPYSNLILDTAGNLYGTASYGGNAGFGTVFKISREPAILNSAA